jgi:hypothetical protein
MYKALRCKVRTRSRPFISAAVFALMYINSAPRRFVTALGFSAAIHYFTKVVMVARCCHGIQYHNLFRVRLGSGR